MLKTVYPPKTLFCGGYKDVQSCIKIQGSPFITLCLGSIKLDRVISEPCYKGIIL